MVAVSAIVGIGSSVAGVLTQVNDAKKRREFEQALSTMSQTQQNALNEKILRAKNDNERLSILINAVAQIKIGQASAKTDKDTKMAMIIIGGGVALLLTIFMIKKFA